MNWTIFSNLSIIATIILFIFYFIGRIIRFSFIKNTLDTNCQFEFDITNEDDIKIMMLL